MKLLFYEILTQIIIFLNRIRGVLKVDTHYRFDRICGFDWKKSWIKDGNWDRMNKMMSGIPAGQIECCDCGLTHLFWIEDNLFFALPIRPPDYKYKMRFLSYKGTYATKEMIDKMKALKGV